MGSAVQLNLILHPDQVVYRAYSRQLDEDGRAQYQDFFLRPNEEALSVAMTPEKALSDLDVRGYVALKVGEIRKLGLDVVPKKNEADNDFLEIIGISQGDAQGFATTLAAIAGMPTLTPEHRARIKALKASLK